MYKFHKNQDPQVDPGEHQEAVGEDVVPDDPVNILKTTVYTSPPPIPQRPVSSLISSSNLINKSDKNKPVRMTRRIQISYNAMSRGKMWEGKIGKEDDIVKISGENLKRLKQGELSSLTEEELTFLQDFKKNNFTLVHFTNAKLKCDGKNKISIKSSYLLEEKQICYNRLNTTLTDVKELSTSGFSFFSLGIHEGNEKSGSRFGRIKWQIPLSAVEDNIYLQHAHMILNDSLDYNYNASGEQKLRSELGDADANKTIEYIERFSSPTETLFHYNDFKDGLALSLLAISKNFDSENRNRLLSNVNNPKVMDKYISLLFRPQILVPVKLASTEFKNGD